jgi:hypothetical protein
MKTNILFGSGLKQTLYVMAFYILFIVVSPTNSFAAGLNALVDDFSDEKNNTLGIPRQLLTDTMVGGATTATQKILNGVMTVTGEIVPPRGQPGWASTVLLLDPKGLATDASEYKGVRLLIKVNNGSYSISANSSLVTNYDYHAAPVNVVADGKFHEIRVPFTSMKRAWSEQTTLDTTTINSFSLVAYGLQKGTFDFAIDEVSLY